MMKRNRPNAPWLLFTVAFVLLAAGLPLSKAVAQESQGEGDAALLERLRYPKTVVLVRHAEKATDDPRDPSLSEEGLLRAQQLAGLLGHSGVTHLYATEYRRTRQTLEPLSLVSGAGVQIVQARDPRALVSAIAELPRGSIAVVAGHSNTVPALVKELSRRDSDTLAESDYDRLYVVTLTGDKGPATVLELRYGAP